ncbi:PREDICTED: INO80 complex subunit B [Myotis brandtii]|uniref:INO80 complex subunit B n=1 Tax=Myotis brandtii TaxID=109478 RepID=UPI0007044B94|nr:PREDICTED: INO80 complex subunit B [Myotis brandtii]
MSKLWRRGSTSGAMEAPEPGEALELSLAGAHGHGVHKKKHKKHKKKHKKKHHQEEEAGPTQPSPAKPQLKLKIKLGGQVLGTKSVPTFTVIPEGPRSPSPLMVVDNEEEPMEGVPLEQYRAWLDEDSNLSPSPLRDLSGDLGGQEEEEEQRWLDALEKGELDDNGDLKKEINERLLTARQRAMLQKAQSQSSPMLPLPVAGGCPAPALTEEMLLKREERARKRRLQAARRAEEHKNQTIERLTKTSFPPGVPTPAPVSQRPPPPGPPPRCSVPGCPHPRRYACSRTGQALCSLQCYRINLQMRLGRPEGPGSPLLAT